MLRTGDTGRDSYCQPDVGLYLFFRFHSLPKIFSGVLDRQRERDREKWQILIYDNSRVSNSYRFSQLALALSSRNRNLTLTHNKAIRTLRKMMVCTNMLVDIWLDCLFIDYSTCYLRVLWVWVNMSNTENCLAVDLWYWWLLTWSSGNGKRMCAWHWCPVVDSRSFCHVSFYHVSFCHVSFCHASEILIIICRPPKLTNC